MTCGIEVYLKLFFCPASFLIGVVLLNHSDPDGESPVSEFIEYDGFHEMVDLCLGEAESYISQSRIFEVILAERSDVFLSFYVIPLCLAYEECILQVAYVAVYCSFT